MKGGKLKQKHIEDFLQDVDDFKFGEKDKINLQQHMTPPGIASKLLYHIYQTQPIQQYMVHDIGIGTGMLMCGCIYIGAALTFGYQIDQQYIEQTRHMLDQKVEGADYELILADISHIKLRQSTQTHNNEYDKMVDLVVMNPPFGTKQAGIDMVFLQYAMSICEGNIYSMHKSTTRKFITKFCEQRGYKMEVLMQVKFPLKKRFKGYHKKQLAFTQVDIIVVKPTKQLIQKRKNNLNTIKKQATANQKQEAQIQQKLQKVEIDQKQKEKQDQNKQ